MEIGFIRLDELAASRASRRSAWMILAGVAGDSEGRRGRRAPLAGDFEFAFGSIDQVDYEVDPFDDSLHVWFKDRYEWHPVYPGLYLPRHSDDFARFTNNVHAAMVELKTSGAADYWMVGEATVPLSVVTDKPV